MSGARRQREAILLPLAIAGLAILAFFLYSRHIGREARAFVAAEDEARAAVTRLLAAQEAFHGRQGRYATLDGLACGSPRSTDCASRPSLTGKPCARSTTASTSCSPSAAVPDGFVWIAPPDRVAPNRLLSQKHFAIAARPIGPARIGYRVYYGDETGAVWFSEGVSDAPGA